MITMEIESKELKRLAKSMRDSNTQNIESFKDKIDGSNIQNEEIAKKKESREMVLCDNMFVQVDEIGLSQLIYSFTDSYDLCTNRTILNTIVDTDNYIPNSMTEIFLMNTGSSRNDTRWFVGGNRWGGSIGSHSGATSTLRKHYNGIAFAIGRILETVEHHRGILEGFVKFGVTSRHYTTSTELAGRAFISRLNYVSDEAINAFTGIGVNEDHLSDGIVVRVRNVLAALVKNLEIAYAKGEELAGRAELLNSAEAVGRHLTKKVELAIYRPSLLDDSKGLEDAYLEQHEER